MNSVYPCLIVEDEPLAQQVLRNYIAEHPGLSLVAVCNSAAEAQQVLQQEMISLMFLDINLPRISGISLLKGLHQPPSVIFTTAYPEYAVEGFELDAVDYLLKPFSLERFLKAVNKALGILERKTPQPADAIFLKADKKIYRVSLDDIMYIEALDDYVKVVTPSLHYLVNDTLKSLQEQLPAAHFIRVHKSYIIAIKQLVFMEGNYVRVGGQDIPVGASYREEMVKWMKRK